MNVRESGLYKKEINDLGGTLNEVSPPTEIDDNCVIESLNWKVHKDGKSRVLRPGCEKFDAIHDFNGEKVRGIFDFWDENGIKRVVVVLEKKIYISDTDFLGWTLIYSQANSLDYPVKLVAFNRERPILVGMDTNLMIEPTQAVLLGAEVPTTAITAAVGAATGLTGDFMYAVTYYRSGNFPVESNPSPLSNVVTLADEKADLSDIPVSTDPKIDTKRIYRTTADGEIFFWLDDIPNAQTTYTDDWTGDLGDQLDFERYIPTLGRLVEVWDERIWIVPKDYPNELHFTNTGTAEEMAHDNIIPVRGKDSDELNGLKAFGDCLYVFKGKSQMYKVNKVGESSYELELLPFATGCDSSASIDILGQPGLMMWKSKFGLEIFDGDRLYRPAVSDLIPNTLALINESTVGQSVGCVQEKENEYWLAVPTGDNSDPSLVIVLDCLKGVLNIYEFPFRITAMHNLRDANSRLTFMNGSSAGYIYRQGEGYTDDGTVINGRFRLKTFRALSGERAVWNVLRRMFVEYVVQPGRKLRMNFFTNQEEQKIGWIDLDSGDGGQRTKRLDMAIRAAYYGFEFEMNEDAAGECRVIGLDAYFKRKFWKKDVGGIDHG